MTQGQYWSTLLLEFVIGNAVWIHVVFPQIPGGNKSADVPFLSLEEIIEVLEDKVCDSSEEMLQELADQLIRWKTFIHIQANSQQSFVESRSKLSYRVLFTQASSKPNK